MSDTWAPVPEGSDFPIENLPFCVFRPRDEEPRVGVRIGDHVVDLVAAGMELDVTARPSLNALMASGHGGALRSRVAELLTGLERPELLLPVDDVYVLMPVELVDYIDFYSSLHHATNLGRHPPARCGAAASELATSARRLPRPGAHGRRRAARRSSAPKVSSLPATARRGWRRRRRSTSSSRSASSSVVRRRHASNPTTPTDTSSGSCCSTTGRRVTSRAFEYQPLGPHLAKSFATTISPWVVTLDALRPFLVEPPEQDPQPDPYLRAALPWGLDLNLTVELNGEQIAATNFREMYWTFAQQLAHLTVNGAPTGAGDLYGSGTVSGPTKGERGSLVELTWRGAEPLTLADGSTRTFLEDGDTVTLRGWCGGGDQPRIGFGEATGTIVATPERE